MRWRMQHRLGVRVLDFFWSLQLDRSRCHKLRLGRPIGVFWHHVRRRRSLGRNRGSPLLQTLQGFDQLAVKLFSVLSCRGDRGQHLANTITACQKGAADLRCESECAIAQHVPLIE